MKRLALILLLWLLGFTPGAHATLCSQVFPANATPSGVVLNLDSIMNGKTYTDFPSTGAHYSAPGQWFYNNGTLGTWDRITVKAGATTWLFFEGDLRLQPQSSINPFSVALDSGGRPQDLIIIVRGNLEIGTKNEINALIYATGNVTLNPQASVVGAITAQGNITLGSNASITYDPNAAATFDLPGACSDGKVNHYRLSYTSQALTCSPHSITVTACSNADCSSTYTDGPSSLTVTPGDSTFSFTGSGTTSIAVRTVQTVTLAISGANPAPTNPLQCRINGGAASSDCSLTFADSGLLVEAPALIAARPDTLRITAVRKSNNSPNCVPAFANLTRQVQLWNTPQSPASPVGSPQLSINGTAISSNSASPSVLTLAFGDSGQASVPISYDDAGYLQLDARYVGSVATGDPGLTMTGTALFSSRPYGLHISSPSDSTCASASVAGCSVLRMAGASFPLTIRAVAWQSDGEALTEAALRNNPTTPNFVLNGIGLISTLVEPSAASGGVAGSFYRHAADGTRLAALTGYDHAQGTSTVLQVGQSEVGIYRITATPPAGAYHGQTVSGGTSALIGRFTPAWLGATASASLTPACGALSYQGQTIGFAGGQPQVALTGYNRQGEPTRNYDRGDFWRLATPQRQPYSLIDAASKPNLAARLTSLGNAQSLAVADGGAADGSRAFDWRADAATARLADALFWQLPSPPQAEDLPFGTSGAAIARLTLAAAQLSDADGVCYRGISGGAASCQDFTHDFGGSEVRVGRLRIDNASGPENQGLDLPYWLESWQGSAASPAFGATSGDACSLAALGQVALTSFTGDLLAEHFPVPPGTLEAAPATTPTPTGVIRLPAPNYKGSTRTGLSGLNAPSALPWLLYDWNGDGVPEAPAGLATFGVQSIQRAMIFRREIYRQ